MQRPMIVRARSCLPLLLASNLACRGAAEAVPADCDIDRNEREALEKDVASLEADKQRLLAELETERGCRQQVLTSLSAFAEGPYDEVVGNTVEDALALLEARVAKREKGEKLAIVLDVDETVLSNIEQLRGSSYCFVRENWNQWVDVGTPIELPGIRPLYESARAHQVAVVFLSGRKETQREDTERVLEAAGFEWDQLLLRSEAEDQLTAAEFKSGRRAKLEAEGYAIALTVGDQQSDLDGGHTEQSVLIPNPFYLVK
jgi:predicted secreted acid phosphatase